MTENTGLIVSEQGDAPKNIRRVTLVVLSVSITAGGAVTLLDPRLGLLSTALIVGWTQLVGL